jgi:hypothetical protein
LALVDGPKLLLRQHLVACCSEEEASLERQQFDFYLHITLSVFLELYHIFQSFGIEKTSPWLIATRSL